jgi:hypothetical protein
MAEKIGVKMPPMPEETFQHAVEKVKEKAGAVLLAREDILVLACDEIIRTFGREEKGYN